jgi:hypothetical protein
MSESTYFLVKTRTRNKRGGVQYTNPTIYRVDNIELVDGHIMAGKPPYFKVSYDLEKRTLDAEPLEPGSREYNKIARWVEYDSGIPGKNINRRLLLHNKDSKKITTANKDEVLRWLSE